MHVGAFLRNIELFDNALFHISERESLFIDPQQRLLLEIIFNGVLTRESPIKRSSGVYVGCMYQEYTQICIAAGFDLIANLITGNGLSYLVGRISYTFNLTGPSVGTDTACSSSLVSLNQARQDLSSNLSEEAIVSGVNLMLSPTTTAGICQMNALSPSGRCKTLDASADGYGRGEGISSIMVKRTTALEEDMVVIKSSLVNQDGRSNGLSAPNGTSQSQLLTGSVKISGITSYHYHSLHGTGTELGDPIEINAATIGLKSTPIDNVVVLGASKGTLGHTEGTAGITGLLLCHTSLINMNTPGITNLRNINQYVESSLRCGGLQRLGLVTSRESSCLAGQDPSIMAGTSSFGMGGTNANTIIEYKRCISAEKRQEVKLHFHGAIYLLSAASWFWPVPKLSPLLVRFLSSARWLLFEINSLFKSSGMPDHMVNGHKILPGSLFICIITAVFQSLENADRCDLFRSIFESPVLITNEISENRLFCRMGLADGHCEIVNRGHLRRVFQSECKKAPLLEGSAQDNQTIKLRSYLKSYQYSYNSKVIGVNLALKTEECGPATLDSYFHLAAICNHGTNVFVPSGILASSYGADFHGVRLHFLSTEVQNENQNRGESSYSTISPGATRRESIRLVSCLSKSLDNRSVSIMDSEKLRFTNTEITDQREVESPTFGVERQVLRPVSYNQSVHYKTICSQNIAFSCHGQNVAVQNSSSIETALVLISIFQQLISVRADVISLETKDTFEHQEPLGFSKQTASNLSAWGLTRVFHTEQGSTMQILAHASVSNAPNRVSVPNGEEDSVSGVALWQNKCTVSRLLKNKIMQNKRSKDLVACLVIGGTQGTYYFSIL